MRGVPPGSAGSTVRPTRRAILLGLVAAAVVLAACSIGVSVSSYCQPSPGRILFGKDLDPSNDALRDCSATFKQEGDFAFVGIFPRHVTGAVVMNVALDGAPPTRAGGYVFSSPGNFYSGRWHLMDFPSPGSYVLTMMLDGEVLATGAFTLTE